MGKDACIRREHTASKALAEGESIYRVKTYSLEIKGRWVGHHSKNMGHTLIIPMGTLLMILLGWQAYTEAVLSKLAWMATPVDLTSNRNPESLRAETQPDQVWIL